MAANYIRKSALFNIIKEGAMVDIEYVERSTGNIVQFNGWICTSWHSSGNTLKLKNPQSGQFRALRRILIIKVNGVKVIF